MPTELTEQRFYEYDHGGRLLKIEHQLNEQERVVLSEFEYNELGQLAAKKLHSDDEGATFWQTIDYRYNIRGWLTHINDADLSDPDDLFGMELYYETGFEQVYYNGNIAGIKWKSKSDGERLNYGYTYDRVSRIKNAHFVEGENNDWKREGYFNVEIKGYDLNGNITGLKRYGEVEGRQVAIDDLDYYYLDQGNQLQNVVDAGTDEGFRDGNKEGTDYEYDANGNLVVDRNKDIRKITYNHLNLPVVIEIGDDKKIEYVYDAAGMKLTQKVYEDKAADPTLVTDYTEGRIYENGVLKVMLHEEGRLIPTIAGDWEYEYHIKDHQGNVRLTFGKEEEYDWYAATMEADPPSQRIIEVEEMGFENITETEYGQIQALDHTHKVINPDTGLPYLPDARYVSFLDGVTKVIGPAKSLKVMPGDHVDVDVFVKYEEIDVHDPEIIPVLGSVILGAFHGAFFNAGSELLINRGIVNSDLLLFGNLAFGDIPEEHDPNGAEIPNAYLNYLLFDKDFNLVGLDKFPIGSAGLVDATKPDLGDHEEISIHLDIEQEGYVYLYVSNETKYSRVYFDDFIISHGKSRIIQKNDYYPFGSDMTALASYREGKYPNNFLYQGQEKVDLFNGSEYEFMLRNYQAELGRWNSVDPYDQFNSPYLALGNSPVSNVDPDGGWSWVGFGVGALIGGTAGYVASGGDWEYAAAGALGGGIAGGFLGDLAHSTTSSTYSGQANAWDRFTAKFGEGKVRGSRYLANGPKVGKLKYPDIKDFKFNLASNKLPILNLPGEIPLLAPKFGTQGLKELPKPRTLPPPDASGVTLVDGDVENWAPAAPQIQTGWNTLQNIASYLSMTKGASVDISFINTRFPMAMTNTTVRRIGDRIIGTATSTFDMQSHMYDRLFYVERLLYRLGAPKGSVNTDIPGFNYFRNNSSVGFGFR